MRKLFNRKITTTVSPFLILGVLLVLLPLFTYMTLDRMDRQKEHIRERVLVKGISLIRTFEAGTRTGMLTMQWGAQRVQAMLMETAVQPDIAYIMITDRGGRILAHSDPDRVGTVYENLPHFPPMSDQMPLVFSRDQRIEHEPVLEVYKRFIPLGGGFKDRHRHKMRMDKHFGEDGFRGRMGDQEFFQMEELYIFAGLSMVKMEELENRMAKMAIGRGIVLFLIGCAGVIVLFAFQAYRSAKASLSRVKAFSDHVVQNMPSGLVTLDNKFKITSANAAAKKILGELPDRAYPQMIQLAHEISGKEGAVSKEVSLKPDSPEALRLDMTASCISGEEGEVQGYIFLFRDLTRLKELLKEVETNRRLAAIGKLAGGVAHEIRNPLSSIKGFATYFGKRYENNPDDAETAKIMVQEVERINRSITQLLEFANPMAVEKKEVEIEPQIRHSLKLLSHDLARKQIQSKVRIKTEGTRMLTDPDRLNQVLLNLYMNGIAAMENGGELRVEVLDYKGPDQIKGLEIRVTDNGCGIDPKHVEELFDPYFTTRPDGTGLGLAIVHRIVENLKGEIRVESEPGKGSCFNITLPGADLPGQGDGRLP
jgi:two-component system sensor histidine kinase HydH